MNSANVLSLSQMEVTSILACKLVVAIRLTIVLAGALVLKRLMASLLFEVSPTDPITFGVGDFCVIFPAARVLHPARRATKVDPLIALRLRVEQQSRNNFLGFAANSDAFSSSSGSLRA